MSDRSVGFRRQIDGGVLAATINLQLEIETIAFVEGAHASTLNGADVHEGIRLAIVALNEAEALHRVEEFDSAAGLFTRQLTLRTATVATGRCAEAACTGFARFTRRTAIGNRQRLAVDDQIGRRHLAATIDESETKRLSLGKAGQTGLLNSADVHEHVFAAIVTNDEAEALLSVKEFDDTLAFANDLGRHAATTAAAASTAAAESTAAACAATKTTTVAAAAKAAAITEAAATSTTAETAAITKTAATESTATAALIGIEILVAETVPLVLAAPAATSVKTHALLVTFASPAEKSG
jgi:hypothetical protein